MDIQDATILLLLIVNIILVAWVMVLDTKLEQREGYIKRIERSK